ncbi:MAG: thioredoxin family protein, partial [Pseudomonadota bacterium]
MLVHTPQGEIGSKIVDFKLTDVVSSNSYTNQELQGENGLVIVFICNHCPYVVAIAGRLAQDTETLAVEGINVLAITTNDYQSVPADSPQNMKRFADHYGFKFPYLVDEKQSVGKAYGAVCTPDFFGLNAQGELQYRGRLDDAGMGDATNRTPELVNAMRIISQTGKGPVTQSPSMG